MKKNYLMMLALMLTTSLTMMADNDRVINFDDLIKAHVKATFQRVALIFDQGVRLRDRIIISHCRPRCALPRCP